jgi:hypothetical protein
MPRGDPSPKIAITVTRQIHDMVVAAAKAEGVSVSAWLTEAARRRLLLEDGLVAVREFELEYGAFTEEELAEARRQLAEEAAAHAAAPRRRSRRTG